MYRILLTDSSNSISTIRATCLSLTAPSGFFGSSICANHLTVLDTSVYISPRKREARLIHGPISYFCPLKDRDTHCKCRRVVWPCNAAKSTIITSTAAAPTVVAFVVYLDGIRREGCASELYCSHFQHCTVCAKERRGLGHEGEFKHLLRGLMGSDSRSAARAPSRTCNTLYFKFARQS